MLTRSTLSIAPFGYKTIFGEMRRADIWKKSASSAFNWK